MHCKTGGLPAKQKGRHGKPELAVGACRQANGMAPSAANADCKRRQLGHSYRGSKLGLGAGS